MRSRRSWRSSGRRACAHDHRRPRLVRHLDAARLRRRSGVVPVSEMIPSPQAGAARIESTMRPYCQNRDACAAAKPTTHCRRCSIMRVASDPELEARRVEKLRVLYRDPAYLDEHRARLRASIARARQDPAFMESLRRNGRRLHRDFLSRPDVVARNRSPEVRKAAGAKTSEKRLGWCPPELRAEYRYLVRSKLIPAAEARKIIEAEIAGTSEHGKRIVASNDLNMRLKDERQKAQAY